MAFQWLGLGAFTAKTQVWSLVRDLRFHKLQPEKKKKKSVVAEGAFFYPWP